MHVGLNVFWLPKETILQKVKEAAEKAKPGEWIRGTGWINTIWEGDNDFPTKEDLDAVAPNNPVYLSRACGHVCWVNSKAIELAGITNDTPNPQGGYIYRDKTERQPVSLRTPQCIRFPVILRQRQRNKSEKVTKSAPKN